MKYGDPPGPALPVVTSGTDRGGWADARHATTLMAHGATVSTSGDLLAVTCRSSCPPGRARRLRSRCRWTALRAPRRRALGWRWPSTARGPRRRRRQQHGPHPGTGLLTADESERVAATLGAPHMMGPLGIRTLSADNPAYNPLGYHTGSVWTHDTAICAHGLARSGPPGAGRSAGGGPRRRRGGQRLLVARALRRRAGERAARALPSELPPSGLGRRLGRARRLDGARAAGRRTQWAAGSLTPTRPTLRGGAGRGHPGRGAAGHGRGLGDRSGGRGRRAARARGRCGHPHA